MLLELCREFESLTSRVQLLLRGTVADWASWQGKEETAAPVPHGNGHAARCSCCLCQTHLPALQIEEEVAASEFSLNCAAATA